MRTFRGVGIFLASIFLLAATETVAFAADATVRGVLNRTAPAAGLTNACSSGSCVPTIVGGLINIVLGILGILLIGYVVYAGYLWMTAGGESKRVEEAQKVLRNAVIGVAVIGFSYTLTGLGLRFVENAFNPTAPSAPAPEVAAPGAPAPVVEAPVPVINPFREGCQRTTCTSECIPQLCGNFTGQRRFTCEQATCRTQCEARCGLDGPPIPTAPVQRCTPLADYRQCLANCATDIDERAARREFATRVEQSEELSVCNTSCDFLYCTR
ncbi:hypothetical protein KBD61_02645 [Patescibacteria group bacterium]|nr:hypothetical protein [Patescibacteria group bacterium]MBP9709903.1 hypothetical protein [Patescibacteria group bacterium]